VFRRPADLVVAQTVAVESVLPARIEAVADGLVDLRVGDGRLRAVDPGLDESDGEVFACIRAEDVTLERGSRPAASARNHLPGRLAAVETEGAGERVTIGCWFPAARRGCRQAG